MQKITFWNILTIQKWHCKFTNSKKPVWMSNPFYVYRFRESKFTFLLYLNDYTDFRGGETLFYNTKADTIPTKTILPEKGKLVIFDHTLWHQGALVDHGNKYILRSDIIVKKNSKPQFYEFRLDSLQPGEYRELTTEEKQIIQRLL